MSENRLFSNLGLKQVRPWTYPGTYAVIRASSLMAEQSTNRDSASWKKAEHIIVDEYRSAGGMGLIPLWKLFISATPDDSTVEQKLYVNIGGNRYAVYDADGRKIGEGQPFEIISRPI